MKSKTKAFALAAVLIGAALGGAFYWNQRKQKSQWTSPRRGPVIEAIYGLATVIAPQTHQIKTGVAQQLTEVFVQEGDPVAAGAPLLKLGESGINRAPFAGTVTAIPFKKGEIVFPSTSALTLVNLKQLHLEVALEQQSVMRVKPGQKAMVSFEALRGSRLETQVTSVFPRESQFIVKLNLPNIPDGVLPGMTADVAIEVGKKDDVISVPVRAIAGGKIALKRNGKTSKEAITLGVIDGEWAEVVSPTLELSDQVLVRAP